MGLDIQFIALVMCFIVIDTALTCLSDLQCVARVALADLFGIISAAIILYLIAHRQIMILRQ